MADGEDDSMMMMMMMMIMMMMIMMMMIMMTESPVGTRKERAAGSVVHLQVASAHIIGLRDRICQLASINIHSKQENKQLDWTQAGRLSQVLLSHSRSIPGPTAAAGFMSKQPF